MNRIDNCSLPHCKEAHIPGLYLVRNLKAKEAILTDCPVRIFWGTLFVDSRHIEIFVGEIPVPLVTETGPPLVERLRQAARRGRRGK